MDLAFVRIKWDFLKCLDQYVSRGKCITIGIVISTYSLSTHSIHFFLIYKACVFIFHRSSPANLQISLGD